MSNSATRLYLDEGSTHMLRYSTIRDLLQRDLVELV